jgi:hypothetical protein
VGDVNDVCELNTRADLEVLAKRAEKMMKSNENETRENKRPREENSLRKG